MRSEMKAKRLLAGTLQIIRGAHAPSRVPTAAPVGRFAVLQLGRWFGLRENSLCSARARNTTREGACAPRKRLNHSGLAAVLAGFVWLAVFSAYALIVTGEGNTPVGVAKSETNNLNGLYHSSTQENAPTIQLANGSSVRLGGKAIIQIFKARVYSLNNDNTNFLVSLTTADEGNNNKNLIVSGPVVLRVGDHGYSFAGGNGYAGRYDEMQFQIPNDNEAKAAAQWLSVECTLRANPGYKIHPGFVPAKSEFHTNEPVLVKFVMKNLDDRTISCGRETHHRNSRNHQFDFQATFSDKPVADVGDAEDWGDFWGQLDLKPGEAIEEQIDLNRWFAFDKPGTYAIHGVYHLVFYQRGDTSERYMPWTVMWNDKASADFTVVVK